MDEQEATTGPRSRRAFLRALPTPADVELYIQDEPALLEVMGELPEPRVADLDALLRDVDDLRSTLRRDLGLAATAAEAGEDELAGWLVRSESERLNSFEERALGHLSRLEQAGDSDEPLVAAVGAPRRIRRRLPAAPLVAACAALFGFLTIPGTPSPTTPNSSSVALESYTKLAQLATQGASERKLTEAAQQFHADLAPLMATASTNPEAVERAIALLQSERAVIAPGADSPALLAVLRQADALVARLRASLPRKPVRPAVIAPPVPEQPRSSTQRSADEPRPTSSAKSSPSAKASPSPSSSPKPSSSPSSPNPSATPSDSGPFPPTTPL